MNTQLVLSSETDWIPLVRRSPRPSIHDCRCSATKRVVLKIGELATSKGLPVTLQIGNEGELPALEASGWLPSTTPLEAAQRQWQAAYQQLLLPNLRINVPAVQVTNVSVQAAFARCSQMEQKLVQQINAWLNAECFRPIKETLLAELLPSDEICLMVQTDSVLLRSLPLHTWDWFDRYPNAAIALSPTCYRNPSTTGKTTDLSTGSIRILAVLGDSAGLDVWRDFELLKGLPNVSLTCLSTPDRAQLDAALWQQSWDMLFFAGHTAYSKQLRLNSVEATSLDDLKHALKSATRRGLKLAIFNTCGSLQLVDEVRQEMMMPPSIVMRHPVPDEVAYQFLRCFLVGFSEGRSLAQAVKIAREQLQGIESQFPFASWLPVLCQNSAAVPLVWSDLCG